MMNALKSEKKTTIQESPETERKRDIGRVWHLYLYTVPFIYILNIPAFSLHSRTSMGSASRDEGNCYTSG